ncbi:MAG: hexokinase [Armatimonadota bacterium]
MMTIAPIGYDEFTAYLEKLFKITTGDIKIIIQGFHSEMQKGLSGFASSLKMIPAFVDKPKGTEKGKFLALDLGGTNLRVLAVELDGKGSSNISAVSKFILPKKAMTGKGEELFDFIAECIEAFLDENGISKTKKYDLAFTFSFPVEQTNIAAGKLIVWTKGFTAKGVEGKDVIILLNEALKRKGIKCIQVAALANDTVGTLAAKSYNDPNCDMGVILGTGTNACYPEKIANIKKWRGVDPKGTMVINMEWGNFNKLRFTPYDKEVDDESLNTGCQYLEKMVSGMYLGEITRIIICDLIKRGLIFNDPDCKVFIKKDSFQTEDMSLIASDESANYSSIEEFLTLKGITEVTLHDKLAMKKLCQFVSTRAAKVAAGAISAVITWIDPKLKNSHTVGVDGTLYEKYPRFSNIMIEVFQSLFKEKASRIKLALAKDGSGKGAAIIAAIAASKKAKT